MTFRPVGISLKQLNDKASRSDFDDMSYPPHQAIRVVRGVVVQQDKVVAMILDAIDLPSHRDTLRSRLGRLPARNARVADW